MLCFVFNGVRVFLCLVSVPSASLAFSLCRVFCVRAPPWLAVLGSRRGCASPRSASLCGGSRAPRRVSRSRARSRAPALRGRLLCAPAPALPALPSCLSAFRWCVHLWGTPRAALRCGECLLCSCRLLRFRFVCVPCDILPRALFVRAPRAMFAVVRPRLSVCVQLAIVSRVPLFTRPPSRSFLALLRARARSSRVRLLVSLRFTRAGRFD